MTICCVLMIIVGTGLSFSSGSDLTGRTGLINPEVDFNFISSNAFANHDEYDWQLDMQHNCVQEFFETLNNFTVYGEGLKKTAAKFSKSISSFSKSTDANLAKCSSDITKVLEDALKHDLYALRMLDAWGRPNGGILEGNVRWPGHYHECKEAKSEEISGKWCNSFWGFRYIPHPMGYPIDASLGTCFPSTCSEESIKVLLSAFFNVSTHFPPLLEVTCTTPVTEFSLSTADIIGIVISAVFVVCVVIGTVTDGVMRLKQNYNEGQSGARTSVKSTIVSVILCFSAISNGEKLLDMTQRPGAIPVLDGIRFISTTWVILGHSFFYIRFVVDNIAYANRMVKSNPSLMSIINGTMSVDTFFVLSGLLVSYLGIKHLHKTKGRMNIPLMYLQRYLRLTPLYAYLILFSVGLYKYTGSGPFWQYNVDAFYNQCKDTWYSNLLYINNVYPAMSPCYEVSWYLASDMQFYILSPIFLLLLYKKRTPKLSAAKKIFRSFVNFVMTSCAVSESSRFVSDVMKIVSQNTKESKILGSVLIFFVLVANVLTTGLLTYFSDLQPALMSVVAPLKLSFRFFVSAEPQLTYDEKYRLDTYYTPWCRIGAYMIGILTGYVLYEYKGKIRMHKVVAGLGWIISAAVACAIIYGLYPNVRDDTKLSTELATLYQSLARPIWSVCIAWVVIACTSGYGGPITTFLNWPVFTPFSRLTYSAYLIHPLVGDWYLASQETPMHLLPINVMYSYLGTLVITFGCAFVTCLFVEFPIVGLMKILFPPPKSKIQAKNLHKDVNATENGSPFEKTNGKDPATDSNGEEMILDEVISPKLSGKSSFVNDGYQTDVFEGNTSL